MTSLSAPDPSRAHALVTEGLTTDAVVTIVGRCEVDYEGRTTSYLGPGDRLVILKPDGTLLVHRPEQRDPVNWQPPGCAHDAHLTDGRLHVRSIRGTPPERVDIAFDAVYQVSVLELTDEHDLELVGSEEDLRQRILRNPSLVEEGFSPRATERATAAGAVDIYGEDRSGTPVIVELKRRRVGPDAVGQLARYVDAAERERADEHVRGILVAPSVTERAERLLDERGLEFVALEPEGALSKRTTLDAFRDEID